MPPIVISRETGKIISAPVITQEQRNKLWEHIVRGYAQKHPENYRNLLVRVTGYNAYFTSVGRELQNEIIARESHRKF